MEQLTTENARDHDRVAHAIRYLARHRLEQPSLEEVAGAMGLSPFHAQRLFTRWAGLSPKRFLGLLTVEHAKELLRGTESVMGTAYEVGLSGPSRLHDLFLTFEAMTPGEYKVLGRDMNVRYGQVPTPFGEAAVLLSDRGICGLAFVQNDPEAAMDELMAHWRLASFVEDTQAVGQALARAFGPHRGGPVPIVLKGTPFQLKVWEALLRIPQGETASYDQVATAIGHPGAVRAVGTAIGDNKIGYLIPCHRVLRKTGAITGYHWGPERKRAMLAWERTQALQAAE